METSDLAKRMKRYEAVSKTTLVTRMPVILRIDGKAFHTLTRGFQKPFDRVLNLSMMETMRFCVRIFRDVYWGIPNQMRSLWCLWITKS